MAPKQKGVTWQEGHDHQTRLDKDHHEQQGVNPQTMVTHKSLQVFVDVQNKVQEKGDEFHGIG